LKTLLKSFIPQSLNTHPKEWSRAAVGACLGIFISAMVCQQLFGTEVALHLLGPVGASAVLLFAVSTGALAQPWSIIGSYLIATLAALVCIHLLGNTITAASLAVCSSILFMCICRCLHPPGAAIAICIVTSRHELSATGLQVLNPVMLNAMCLLLTALIYNNVTRVRYPKPHPKPIIDDHHTLDVPSSERVGFNAQDLEQALDEMGEFIDVSREDLEDIIRKTEKHALRRSMGDIQASHIMSRDVQCLALNSPVSQAMDMLLAHHIKCLPVLDEYKKVVGIVSLVDLIAHPLYRRKNGLLDNLGLRKNVRVHEVMTRPVKCVESDVHVVELIPLMSDLGLHSLPVLEKGALVGIITQTDLIEALHRDLIVHLH
jgi:CBS domain-containing membrane protein